MTLTNRNAYLVERFVPSMEKMLGKKQAHTNRVATWNELTSPSASPCVLQRQLTFSCLKKDVKKLWVCKRERPPGGFLWDQGVDLAPKPSPSCSSLDSCQTVIWLISPLRLCCSHGWDPSSPTRWLLTHQDLHFWHWEHIHFWHLYMRLYTYTIHYEHIININTWKHLLFYSRALSYITPLLTPFHHPSILPLTLTPLFSLRMGTWRPRSWFTATMWSATIPTRLCALARWIRMRTCCWPASTATSTAGDPTSPLR